MPSMQGRKALRNASVTELQVATSVAVRISCASMGKRPVGSLSEEARERLSTHETDQLYRTIRTGMWCLTTAFIFYSGFRSFEAFAGQNTNLSVAMSLVLQAFAEAKVFISITLAGGCAGWAMVERVLRHRKVEQLQGRIKELETKIDPNRSSSNLTPRGKTNPKDKLR